MNAHKPLPEDDTRSVMDDERIMWDLVSEISQGLQMSFASIKAAVSSLLDGNIFWDQAAQHEFMQTIDKSVDDSSSLTAVMTLAMRCESQTLIVHREPNSLQEILSQAKDLVQKDLPDAIIELSLPTETRPAFVDFEYLRMALRLLIEVLLSANVKSCAPMSIQMLEKATEWQLVIETDSSGLTNDLINWLSHHAPERFLFPINLRAEIKLKALVSYQLLTLQAIKLTTSSAVEEVTSLVLYVPYVTEA